MKVKKRQQRERNQIFPSQFTQTAFYCKHGKRSQWTWCSCEWCFLISLCNTVTIELFFFLCQHSPLLFQHPPETLGTVQSLESQGGEVICWPVILSFSKCVRVYKVFKPYKICVLSAVFKKLVGTSISKCDILSLKERIFQ